MNFDNKCPACNSIEVVRQPNFGGQQLYAYECKSCGSEIYLKCINLFSSDPKAIPALLLVDGKGQVAFIFFHYFV